MEKDERPMTPGEAELARGLDELFDKEDAPKEIIDPLLRWRP
jgi:hypothetical protein